jgi:hypothetical protein
MHVSRRREITDRARAALGSLRSGAVGGGRFARNDSEQPRTNEELHERLERLESVVEGLQDAVHRESVRHDELIEALQKRTDAAEMARALSDDARRRGL